MPYATTNDGCRISYEDAGSGKPLVLIHGWSQTSALFKYQVAGLRDRYHVLALDLRGHGDSDKPEHGYRISRLAKDVWDFLTALDLQEVNILGWSMGCCVVWSYLDLFGPERLSKLILVDETPWLVNQAFGWEKGFMKLEEVLGACTMARENQAGMIEWLTGLMVTTEMPPEERAWLIANQMKLPAAFGASLLLHHNALDWRDVVRRITLPTLVVTGQKTPHMPAMIWVHEQIPGSRLEVFDSGHLMFLEEPDKFNALLAEFIG